MPARLHAISHRLSVCDRVGSSPGECKSDRPACWRFEVHGSMRLAMEPKKHRRGEPVRASRADLLRPYGPPRNVRSRHSALSKVRSDQRPACKRTTGGQTEGWTRSRKTSDTTRKTSHGAIRHSLSRPDASSASTPPMGPSYRGDPRCSARSASRVGGLRRILQV